MYQMKTLIEQNHQQARQILIQNPPLTKVLFKAQILLGMVQPSQVTTNIPPAASHHPQQSVQPPQQSNVQAASPLPGQIGLQDQTNASQAPNPVSKPNQPVMPVSYPSVPSSNIHSQPWPSHPLQSVQQPKGHFNAQATAMSLPQSTQMQNMPQPHLHSASQQHSLLQHPMPTISTQSQPLQTSDISRMQLQPSLPAQARPHSMSAFGHQLHSQMGPNAGFQHSGAPQMHHSQPMFHSGQYHPATMGHSFSQGYQPVPTQPPHQSLYQGGGSHLGMERQVGSSMQAERGSSWIPGLRENTTGTQLPFIAGQMGPGSQPIRPPPLTPDMETALLQQVMSLTPERINLLPPEQRNQVLQLQQMLRQ